MARVIGVISGKGGVGKTILAINLAASLYKHYGKNVLLVDANITTPHVGLYLGLYSTLFTLNDVIKGHAEAEKATYKHSSGIHIIPSSLRADDLKNLDWRAARDKLPKIFDNYDFVIIDSSPGFTRESLITLAICNEALFVTNPIMHSAADLIKCSDISRELKVKQLGIVLNMVRGKKYEISPRDIEELVELNVICSIPFEDKIMESILKKRPAIELSSRIDKDILKISKLVTGGTMSISPSKGFFSKMFGFMK